MGRARTLVRLASPQPTRPDRLNVVSLQPSALLVASNSNTGWLEWIRFSATRPPASRTRSTPGITGTAEYFMGDVNASMAPLNYRRGN